MDNPTDQTLEAGPLTVYGEDAFIGEGLTESIPPHATTVVPFAQDRQVLIDRSITFSDRIIRVVGIDRQLMSADLEHRRRTHLLIHNRLTVPTTVYVRQAINDGWTVIAPPTGALRLPTSFLIPVEVAAGGTATLDINEGTPQRRELAMGDRAAMRLLATFAAEGKIDDIIRKPLEQVLATDDAIARAQVEVESLREQQLAYLERTRELAAQLVTLKLVKTAGPLMSELSDKLRELNTLSSQASMMVIAAQDRWLIERARQAAQLIELRVATGAASRLAAADID